LSAFEETPLRLDAIDAANPLKVSPRRFFYVARQTTFEQSPPESLLAQGSEPGAAINEASDENLRGMAS